MFWLVPDAIGVKKEQPEPIAIASTITCGLAPNAFAMEIPMGASTPAVAILFIKEVIGWTKPVKNDHIQTADDENRKAYPCKIQHTEQFQPRLFQCRVGVDIGRRTNQGTRTAQSGWHR